MRILFQNTMRAVQRAARQVVSRAFGGAVFGVALLALPVAVALPMPATAQDLSAVVVAERQNNFGRLVIQFRDRLELPPYELTAENGVLRIVFEDAVVVDIADATRTLAEYVTIARRDPDGRALRFGLARAVRINTMEAGETLFIDFLPSTWQGFPPPLPEEVVAQLAQRAEQAAREAAEAERRRLLGELEPEVMLQVGAAPTFTRYAFNWSVPFNVATSQEGARFTMQFDYDVPIDLNPALIDQADELEAIDFERDGASLKVTMDVVPGSGLRWFEDDMRFIVDLDRETPREDQALNSEEVVQALEAIAQQSGAQQPGTPQASTRFEMAGQRSDAVVVPEELDPVVEQARALTNTDILPSAAEPAFTPNRMGELIDVEPQPNPAPLAGEELPRTLAGRAPEVTPEFEFENDFNSVRVEVRRDGDTTRLVFPFSQPTPAAAFRRENYITLVFETPVPFDLRSLRLELSEEVRSIQPIRINDLSLIHLRLENPALLSIAPSGDSWVVALGPTVLDPPTGMNIGRGTFSDGKAFAEVAAAGFAEARRILHPHVGDTLFVVPMLGPPRGVLSQQSLVEFDLLPSVHGVVVRPKVDGLRVSVEPERVVVVQDRGLTLSEAGLSLGSFGFSPNERPGFIDLRAYLADGVGGYKAQFEAYQSAIAAAEGAVRTERLLDFGRFLLAHGLAHEANGILDIAEAEAASLEHDEAFMVLRGAALTLARRHEDAQRIFDGHAMDRVVDGVFWDLLNQAALHNWPRVNAQYDEASALFDDYPSDLVLQARLDGVEAAIQVQALDNATDRLAQIDPARLVDEEQRYRLDLLDAQLQLAKGRSGDAIEVFKRVRTNASGAMGALATFLSVEAQLDANRLTADEALEELENLAVAWRGDDTEVRARRLLGSLYVNRGQYADALFALKGVLIAQPEHRFAGDVADKMQSVFVDLFLNGEADTLPAIDALAVFYDFRELTPIGRRGDEIVRRLADRLVSIDLLDQAADLLSHQVENRLTGAAKAQVAADLALIYLMDYRPADAVSVLQRSRISQVPMSIERGRRVIEARALSELGRHELALEMLRGLEGDDVAGVRADVLWNAERWMDAGEALERALGDRWNDAVPLDEAEMQRVLRSAIAFTFAEDQFSLNRLRARYDGKMSDGIYASAFDVVTAPIQTQGSAFRDVVRGIAGLNTLNRFLNDYRSTFSSQPTLAASSGA